MALITVQVQGANRVLQKVLLDSITGKVYAVPIYKLGLGDVNTDDGPVSAGNPLPVVLQDPDDATRQAIMDIVFKVPVTIDTGHYAIHNSKSFTADVVDETLSDDATIILAFKTMAGIDRAHMIFEFTTLVGGDLRIWQGPTWTAETGSLVSIINRKRLASMTSSGLLENSGQAAFTASDAVILNPTGLNTGSATELHHLFAWGKKERLAGGNVRDANEWVLKPDTQYAAVFTADGGSNKAQIILNWYENTDV